MSCMNKTWCVFKILQKSVSGRLLSFQVCFILRQHLLYLLLKGSKMTEYCKITVVLWYFGVFSCQLYRQNLTWPIIIFHYMFSKCQFTLHFTLSHFILWLMNCLLKTYEYELAMLYPVKFLAKMNNLFVSSIFFVSHY